MLASMLLAVGFLAVNPAQAATLHFGLDTGVPGQKVVFVAPITRWNEGGIAMRETSPGKYALDLEEPWVEILPYKYIVDGRWISDPSNPLREDDGYGGVNSLVKTSFHEDPWLQRRLDGIPAWSERTLRLDGRRITILTPPGDEPSVTVYFQDGGDYLEQGGVRSLIPNLSSVKGMPRITAVLIPPVDRMKEYMAGTPESKRYLELLCDQIVPAVESALPKTGGSAEKRLLIGPSLGGLITLWVAVQRPDTFMLAASTSGSLWVDEGALLKLLPRAAQQRQKLFLDVGMYEGDEMLKYNREGDRVLRETGASYRFREYPTTHDWPSWRNRLRETLLYFFAP